MSPSSMTMFGAINLESYSASPGWLGYFESAKTLPRREDAVVATRKALDLLGNLSISTSCYTIDGNAALQSTYNVADDDIVEIVEPLRAADLIRSYKDFREAGPLRDASGLSRKLVEKTCLALMDVGGIRGHVFLFSNSHGVIAYPHEDIGFGFIADTAEGRRFGEEVLSLFLSDDRWKGRLA